MFVKWNMCGDVREFGARWMPNQWSRLDMDTKKKHEIKFGVYIRYYSVCVLRSKCKQNYITCFMNLKLGNTYLINFVDSLYITIILFVENSIKNRILCCVRAIQWSANDWNACVEWWVRERVVGGWQIKWVLMRQLNSILLRSF